MDVLVDTSGALENVREKYVAKIEGLLDHNEKLHAPPIVEFGWAEQVFRGVLQSLEITYLLFHIDGKPLRAKLALVLKEYRPVDVRPQGEHADLDRRREALRRASWRDAQLDLRFSLPRPRIVA